MIWHLGEATRFQKGGTRDEAVQDFLYSHAGVLPGFVGSLGGGGFVAAVHHPAPPSPGFWGWSGRIADGA